MAQYQGRRRKYYNLAVPGLALFLISSLASAQEPLSLPTTAAAEVSTAAVAAPPAGRVFTPRRGVHLTGWTAGSPKARKRLAGDLKAAGLNAVAIAVKDVDGRLFVRDVALAQKTGAYMNAIPDLPQCVRDFKEAGIYTIARITVFKDEWLAAKRPDLAVHRPDGGVWKRRGVPWMDPYKREVWDYNIEIASRAAAAGFDEIQFDYIRFPSEGDLKLCRYSNPGHSPKTARGNLTAFLSAAHDRLKPLGVSLSICVFGLTTTVDTGMGIGQHIAELTELVDYVAPMMYPSHYHNGEMGVKNPNREPYKTIHRGVRDAITRLGANAYKLRPYLQDFSLGYRYKAEQVRAQITAAEAMGVTSWMLWNPQNRYTWSAMTFNNRSILSPGTTQFPAVVPEEKERK